MWICTIFFLAALSQNWVRDFRYSSSITGMSHPSQTRNLLIPSSYKANQINSLSTLVTVDLLTVSMYHPWPLVVDGPMTEWEYIWRDRIIRQVNLVNLLMLRIRYQLICLGDLRNPSYKNNSEVQFFMSSLPKSVKNHWPAPNDGIEWPSSDRHGSFTDMWLPLTCNVGILKKIAPGKQLYHSITGIK